MKGRATVAAEPFRNRIAPPLLLVLFAALFFTDGTAPPQYSQCSQFARGHLHAKAKSVFTSEHCEHWERR
jgi:hypothetical protein